MVADRSFVAKDKGYLNPVRRAELEKKLRSLEFNARNIDNVIAQDKPWLYNPKSTNIADLHKQIAKVKKTISGRTPPNVGAKDKNTLFARAKVLERQIRKDMPTKAEMQGKRYLRGDNGKPYVVAAENAIKKQMDWQVRQAGNVREWQQIMRLLDPHDPNVTNVERLRR